MRVASFNVHYWQDREQRSTVAGAIELLRELRCDAVVLQEVPAACSTLPKIAAVLGMHQMYAPASALGNALLSRAAPRSFDVRVISEAPSEARSVFVATLPWEGGMLTLAGTHLDVEREHVRLGQLARALAALSLRQGDGLTLLAGDLNSLRLSDYDPATLERIRTHRASGGVEPPLGAVTERLVERGFIDLWRRARGAQPPMARGELATCWAGTRIDYIWAGASFDAHAHLVSCEHVPTQVSDHGPVVVELRARSLEAVATRRHARDDD